MRRLGERSSLENMTADDLAAMFDPGAAMTEMPWFAGMQRPVMLDQTWRALFDGDAALPEMKVVHLSW